MELIDDDIELPPVRNRRRRAARLGVGLVLGGVAVWAVVSTAGGLADAVESMRQMDPRWIAVGLVVAIARIGLYGLQLTWLSRRSGPMTALDAFGLSLVLYGLGAITPASPAEGLALAARELRRRGRSKQEARLTLGFSEWFAQRTFYAVTAVNLVAVVVIGHLSWSDSWPIVLAGGVVIVVLGATAALARRPATAQRAAALLESLRFRHPSPPAADQQRAAAVWHSRAMSTVGPPANRIRLAIVSAAAVVADATILWTTCTAAGIHLNLEVVLLASTVGTMAGWIPLLPGGLGVVEAVIPVILHRFGAPLADALAATVVYRALGTLVPAVGGGIALPLLGRVAVRPESAPP